MAAASLVDGRDVIVISRNTNFLFLSPTHLYDFKKGDLTFKCVEQYMQYSKAKHFGDNDSARKIMLAKTAKECQRLGAKVYGFSNDVWSWLKLDYMREGLLAKFSQSRSLSKMLARTSGYTLAYCGFVDKFWSCGEASTSHRAYHPPIWSGQNSY
ncbi:uncharacterized protein LOC141857812 [Brevipalpus obovatus]|uniref:uncharacterized protein LOC141857812 n=1 Tax=Brevipalpus obovatus TaxID=246614 RepID=UPI003D9E5ABB